MTKRIVQDQAGGVGGMSREDRKNEAISRMIERQEQLRKKREEKKKLSVMNQGKGTSSGKSANGSSGQRKSKMLQQNHSEHRKPENSRVQIHVMFSDNIGTSNASNRYFFERKQTVEERQRLEEQEMWTRLAQAQLLNQQQRPGQLAFGGQGGLGYYNTGGDTGGNYEALDDYSGSSYLSSASKRIRDADWGPQSNQNQQAQGHHQHPQMMHQMLPRSAYSSMWENQLISQQLQFGQAFNQNQQLADEQSPSANHQMPTPLTPFVNPISAEECSATIEKKDEPEESAEPIQIKIDLSNKKPISAHPSGVTPDTALTHADSMTEEQKILAFTKQLQGQLQSKRMQAAPPADTKSEVTPNKAQTRS